MTNVGEGGINIEKVGIKDENVELKKVARRGLQVCKAKKTRKLNAGTKKVDYSHQNLRTIGNN